MQNLLVQAINFIKPFLGFLPAEKINSWVEGRVTIPKKVHDAFKAGMDDEQKTQFDQLRSKLADAEADYIIFAASHGEIQPD